MYVICKAWMRDSIRVSYYMYFCLPRTTSAYNNLEIFWYFDVGGWEKRMKNISWYRYWDTGILYFYYMWFEKALSEVINVIEKLFCHSLALRLTVMAECVDSFTYTDTLSIISISPSALSYCELEFKLSFL